MIEIREGGLSELKQNKLKKEFGWIGSQLKKLQMDDEARKWEELKSLLDVDLAAFRVVAVGQQNGGKSTLLNALCGRADLDWFETGDRIVTREAKEKEHDGVVYVDTPGLDTPDMRDDLISFQMSKSACVVLFVHSCVVGELDGGEYERLEKFASELDDPSRQIIVLCSKDGEIMEKEKLEDIVGKVREQVDRATGGRTRVMSVDSLDYLEGLRENESRLMVSSNVPDLVRWMQEQRAMPNLAESTLDAVKAGVCKALEARQKELESCCLSAESDQRRSLLETLLEKWEKLKRNSIEPQWQKCVQIIQAIRSLKEDLENLSKNKTPNLFDAINGFFGEED